MSRAFGFSWRFCLFFCESDTAANVKRCDKRCDKLAYHRRTAVRPVLTSISQFNGNGQTSIPHRIKTR